MSVAFRRESDDEHKEPVFELPIPPGPNLVTERGLAQIDAKVSALDAAIAAEADEERGKALRRELRYWQTRRATAEVTVATDSDLVGFGTRVRFRSKAGERTLAIVGMDEAVPAEGTIGFQAPLARALGGAGEGDQVSFNGEVLEVVAVMPIGG